MKKAPQRDPQYFPFDDFQPPPVVVGWPGSETDDIPWRTIAREIKERTRSRDSFALTHLVSEYRQTVRKKGEDEALINFWHSVGSFAMREPSKRELNIALRKKENANIREWLKTAKPVKGLSFLTNEMRLFLYRAKAGEIKAAQIIVRACPESIFLPFIADVMAKIAVRHKYKIKSRDTHEISAHDIWEAFLPKREKVQYTLRDLEFVIKKAVKQDKRPLLHGKEGTSLYEDIAEVLGVSVDYLKANYKIKRGSGRPRK